MTDANNNTQDPAPKTEPARRKFTGADAVDALTLYGKGAVSSFSLRNPIQLCKKNSEIFNLVKKCIVCNGGILFGCIILFRLFIFPLMNKCFPPKVVPGDVEGETRQVNSWPTSIVAFLYNHVILTVVWVATKALNAPSYSEICEKYKESRSGSSQVPPQNSA